MITLRDLSAGLSAPPGFTAGHGGGGGYFAPAQAPVLAFGNRAAPPLPRRGFAFDFEPSPVLVAPSPFTPDEIAALRALARTGLINAGDIATLNQIATAHAGLSGYAGLSGLIDQTGGLIDQLNAAWSSALGGNAQGAHNQLAKIRAYFLTKIAQEEPDNLASASKLIDDYEAQIFAPDQDPTLVAGQARKTAAAAQVQADVVAGNVDAPQRAAAEAAEMAKLARYGDLAYLTEAATYSPQNLAVAGQIFLEKVQAAGQTLASLPGNVRDAYNELKKKIDDAANAAVSAVSTPIKVALGVLAVAAALGLGYGIYRRVSGR